MTINYKFTYYANEIMFKLFLLLFISFLHCLITAVLSLPLFCLLYNKYICLNIILYLALTESDNMIMI